MCWWGDCLKYLKRGWNRKEGRGNKDFKKGGGKLGQGVGDLKRGSWNPLTNYDKDLSVRLSQLVGSTLIFLISEYCLAKRELNSSAFSLKSVINLFSRKIGGIQGTFLLLKNFLK